MLEVMQGAIKRRISQCGNRCRSRERVRDLVELVVGQLKVNSYGYWIRSALRISHFERSVRKGVAKIDRQVGKERFERRNSRLIRRRVVIGLDGNGDEIVFDSRCARAKIKDDAECLIRRSILR